MDKLKIYRKTKLSSNECLFLFKHSTNIFEDKNLWWLAWPSLIFNYNGYALDGGTHGVKDRHRQIRGRDRWNEEEIGIQSKFLPTSSSSSVPILALILSFSF